MRLTLFLIFSFSMLQIVSCSKDTEITPTTELGFEAEKWKSLGILDYDYTLQITCFCLVEYTQPKRIVVRNNAVVSVEGVPYEEINDTSFRTIDGFFEYIEEQRKLNPKVEEIEYDSKYGFPTYIFFDISEMIADEEVGYTLTDFKQY